MVHSAGIHVQHVRNGGEKQIGKYRVDGYYETVDGHRVVLEVNGCYWHGCVSCFSRQNMNVVRNETMDDLHQQTLDKKRYIENEGYIYKCKWDCEFDKEIKKMKK